MAIFSFHIAFLLIMLGAGVTRQFSFEGIMVIKEGETSDFIFSADPHLLVKVQNKKTGKSKVIGKSITYPKLPMVLVIIFRTNWNLKIRTSLWSM